VVVVTFAVATTFFSGADDLNNATIAISDMSTAASVDKITAMLQSLDGVAAAEVNLEDGSARVKYDPTLITVAAMESEISKLGFSTANFKAESCAPTEQSCDTEKTTMDCCAPAPKRSDT